MCLIVFAWRADPEHRLILAANRDELHARPSQDAHWWPDNPAILGGRDLQAGGTWLAVSKDGRFATVTNYRENRSPHGKLLSRGALVTGFIDSGDSPLSFAHGISAARYAGFNLLACDGEELVYSSNRGDAPVSLAPGVYGLANESLDTPWPKLLRSRQRLADALDAGVANETEMMRILADREPAPVDDINADRLPFELARAVSAPFIIAGDYGTRCSTVLSWSEAGKIRFSERRFDSSGEQTGESTFQLEV